MGGGATQGRDVAWLLLALSLAFGQQTPPPKCVFAGVVQDSVSGQPIRKATVSLFARKGGAAGYTGATDASGTFRFEAVAPGDYTIMVICRGYGLASAVALKPGQSASTLHFAAGQGITGVVATLDPPAVISGRVTDEDGEPLAGAQVELLSQNWRRGDPRTEVVEQAAADERGEYRFRVSADRYYVAAGRRLENVPAIFSDGPGKPERTTGSAIRPDAIEPHPGQQVNGIDFKLSTVACYHVRGVVRPGVDWKSNRMLLMTLRDGPRMAMNRAVMKNDAFDFSGVTPGSYSIFIFSPIGDRIAGEVAVDVADRDVNGVVFHAISPFTLKGHMRFDDSDPHDFTGVALFLNQLDWTFVNWGLSASGKPDGSFQFDNVPGGEFVVNVSGPPEVYIESVTYNRRDAPGQKLDLKAGAAGELEVVLGAGTGQIGGTVHWPEGIPGAPPAVAANLKAVAAPVNGVSGNTGVRTREIDQEGRFRLTDLPPGRYFVWVVKHFDDHWQNMEFVTQMQGRGVAVDLPKKGSVQVEIPEVIE